MKVTNIGNKIISLGLISILPGETKDIPETYSTNSVLEALVKRGRLTIRKNAAKAAESAPATKAKAAVKDDTAAEAKTEKKTPARKPAADRK